MSKSLFLDKKAGKNMCTLIKMWTCLSKYVHVLRPAMTPFLLFPLMLELHITPPVVLQWLADAVLLFKVVYVVHYQPVQRHVLDSDSMNILLVVDLISTHSFLVCLSILLSFSSCTRRLCSSSFFLRVAAFKFVSNSCEYIKHPQLSTLLFSL